MEEIRSQLKEFVSFDQGKQLRKALNESAKVNYRQKYSDTEHLDFMERHVVTFSVNHPQSENHPYYYQMFTIITQHLMADSIRECLDKAIDIEKQKASV